MATERLAALEEEEEEDELEVKVDKNKFRKITAELKKSYEQQLLQSVSNLLPGMNAITACLFYVVIMILRTTFNSTLSTT